LDAGRSRACASASTIPAAYGELLAAQIFAGAAETRGFLDQALAVAASQQHPRSTCACSFTD
jgi:hypothetical protein